MFSELLFTTHFCNSNKLKKYLFNNCFNPRLFLKILLIYFSGCAGFSLLCSGSLVEMSRATLLCGALALVLPKSIRD